MFWWVKDTYWSFLMTLMYMVAAGVERREYTNRIGGFDDGGWDISHITYANKSQTCIFLVCVIALRALKRTPNQSPNICNIFALFLTNSLKLVPQLPTQNLLLRSWVVWVRSLVRSLLLSVPMTPLSLMKNSTKSYWIVSFSFTMKKPSTLPTRLLLQLPHLQGLVIPILGTLVGPTEATNNGGPTIALLHPISIDLPPPQNLMIVYTANCATNQVMLQACVDQNLIIILRQRSTMFQDCRHQQFLDCRLWRISSYHCWTRQLSGIQWHGACLHGEMVTKSP